MDNAQNIGYTVGMAFGIFLALCFYVLFLVVFALLLRAACWVIARDRQPDFSSAMTISFFASLIWVGVMWGVTFLIGATVGEGTQAALMMRVGALIFVFLAVSGTYSSTLSTNYLKGVGIVFTQGVVAFATCCAPFILIGSFAGLRAPGGFSLPGQSIAQAPGPTADVPDARPSADVELVSDALNDLRSLRPLPSYTAPPGAPNTARIEPRSSAPPFGNTSPAAPEPSTRSGSEAPILPGFSSKSSLIDDLDSSSVPRIRAATAKIENTSPDDNQKEINTRLLRLLASNDLSTRHSAARALARWGDADIVDDLIKALAHTDRMVRLEMMNALANIKGEKAIAALIKMLKTERDKARDALIQVGQTAEEPVRAALKDRDMWVREAACKILETIGTADSVKALDNATRDRENVVRRAAIDALRAVRGERAKGKS